MWQWHREFHYKQEVLCKLRLLRTYKSHYERHKHLVSAKYSVAKFNHLNFALYTRCFFGGGCCEPGLWTLYWTGLGF